MSTQKSNNDIMSQPIEVDREIHQEPKITTAPLNDFNSLYKGILANSNKWIELACEKASESVKSGGGPFGAIILQIDTQTNQIIRYWDSSNKVTLINDPTAHAEIMAIRSACSSLGVFNLGEIKKEEAKLSQPGDTSHCVIYSSCEPCPMCFSAIFWSRIPSLYFAASRFDAAQPGVEFSDKELYSELKLRYKDKKTFVYRCIPPNATEAFELWKDTPNINY